MRFSAFFASTAIAYLSLGAQPARAVDAVTAGLIVEGVNFVTSALEKPLPNLTLEVVQRNRALLIGMNTKLDQLGENLIKLHAAIGNIPAELAEELDKERIYVLGTKATARGLSLLGYIEEFEDDRSLYVDRPSDLQQARRDYRARLGTLEIQATNLGNEIIQEPSIKNVDAVTLGLIAHSHLSILTEIVVRFDRRINRLRNAAQTYVWELDEVLANQPGTLTGWTSSGFASLPVSKDWKQLQADFDIPSIVWSGPGHNPLAGLRGSVFEQCIVRQNQRIVHEFRPPIPSAGEPAHDQSSTTTLSDDFFIRTLRFGKGTDRAFTAALVTSSSFSDCRDDRPVMNIPTVVEYVQHTLGRNLEIVKTSRHASEPEDCLTSCKLGEQQSALDSLLTQLRTLDPSVRILSMLSTLREDAAAVRKGDYSGFQVADTLSSLAIYRDTIREQIDELDRLSRLAEVEALDAERLRVAREVTDLIERQDREIAAVFEKAAKASKFNRNLGYIRVAAKLFEGWVKLDGYLSKGEKQAAKANLVAAMVGLEAAISLEPENAPLFEQSLKILSHINSLSEFYGDLETAHRSQVRFERVLAEVIDEIAPGTKKDFDVYVSDSDPLQFRFVPAPAASAAEYPDETYLKRITLEGKSAGIGDAIEVHVGLRSL